MAKQLSFIGDIDEIIKPRAKPGRKRSTQEKKTGLPVVYDCNTCGLSRFCRKPKINRFGNGNSSILIVGLCPGREEDRYGIPLVGASGRFMKEMLDMNGFSMDDDCIRTNVVRCYPGKDKRGRDRPPTNEQVQCCRTYLERDIEEVNPHLILCLGTEAITSILGPIGVGNTNASTLHGKVIPHQNLGCWVGCLFHPSFFIHRENSKEPIHDRLVFAYDLANILGVVNKPLPETPTPEGNTLVDDPDDAIDVFKSYTGIDKVVGFDLETTTLEPDEEGADIISVSITDRYETCYFIPIIAKNQETGKSVFDIQQQAMVMAAFGAFIKSSTPKTVQNYYMEELWCRKFLGHGITNFVHDTMVSSHVVGYSNKRCTSLAFQSLEYTGHVYKDVVDRSNLIHADLTHLCNYNCYDSRHTVNAYHQQRRTLSFDKKLDRFNSLFTRGLHTLANMKERGIRIDVKRMESMAVDYEIEEREVVDILGQLDSIKTVVGKVGKEFNPNSPKQLQTLIYKEFGVEQTWERSTKGGNPSTKADILEEIERSTSDEELKTVIGLIMRVKKCAEIQKKIREYRRIIHSDGKIHPTFGLNTADSFRSSARPNSQNTYKHDPELKKFRRIFIPEPNHVLLEGDYKSMEVRTIAMVSAAKELLRYIVEKIDSHKYWAGKIFKKSIEEIDSDEKYEGKNGFVFPSFYGSLPPAITKYFGGKFSVEYIKSIQDEFWSELPEVREWQERTINNYYQTGYIDGITGFKISGPLTVYQLFNLPVQGSAFHIFLDSMSDVDDYLIANSFNSMIINEIHDANIYSADKSEVDEVIEKSTEIMTRKRFDWMGDVPLEVDWEIGENWYDMESYHK